MNDNETLTFLKGRLDKKHRDMLLKVQLDVEWACRVMNESECPQSVDIDKLLQQVGDVLREALRKRLAGET